VNFSINYISEGREEAKGKWWSRKRPPKRPKRGGNGEEDHTASSSAHIKGENVIVGKRNIMGEKETCIS